MGSQSDTMLTLISNDGKKFVLPLEAAELAAMIQEYGFDADDEDAEYEMHVPRADSVILSRVVDFMIHHAQEPMDEIPIPLGADSFEGVISQEWYVNFANNMLKDETLFKILGAANFMSIRPLLDLCCLQITFKLENKNAEEIREYLNLPELTAEEEEDARRRHPWIFENNN